MTEKWGPYEIIGELGRGGMGVVYKALDQELRRQVAIKVLGERYAGDKKLMARFTREARGAASLNHPHIIQVYQIGNHEGRPYFVMEYVEGETLGQLIRREKTIPPYRAAELLLETASGLAAAHAAGIIHRDIKPANIMISRDGLVKVADFGIAQVPEPETRLTETGQFLGTPGYLSPEVCTGEPCDIRSDIFSLGLVYFEMLTGRTPFDAESPYAMMQQIVAARIPDVRQINTRVDQASRDMLERMVQREPVDRYQNCDILIADLKNYLAGPGTAKSYTQPMTTTVSGKDADHPSEQDTDSQNPLTDPLTPESSDEKNVVAGPWIEPYRPSRSPRIGLMATAALLVVLVVAAGVYWTRHPSEGVRSEQTLSRKGDAGGRDATPANPNIGSSPWLSAENKGLPSPDVSLSVNDSNREIEDFVSQDRPSGNPTNPAAATSHAEPDQVVTDPGSPEKGTGSAFDRVVSNPAKMSLPTDSVVSDIGNVEHLSSDIVVNDSSAVEFGPVDSSPAGVETGSPGAVPLNRPTTDAVVFDFDDPSLVVHAVGDPLLAVNLQGHLEKILDRDNRRVLDKAMNTALDSFKMNEPLDPRGFSRAAYDGGADVVLLAEIVPFGEEEVTSAGERTSLSVAQIRIEAVLAANGRKLNLRCYKDVRYTALSAADIARETIHGFRSRIRDVLDPKNLEAYGKRNWSGAKSVGLVAIGNDLLASPLVGVIARRLEKKGYVVLDDFSGMEVESMDEMSGLVAENGGDVLIRISAQDLASREVEVRGNYSLVQSARIEIRCIDPRARRGLGQVEGFNLEYTSLNAVDQIEERGKRMARNLIKNIESLNE